MRMTEALAARAAGQTEARWSVIATHPNAERLAHENLVNQGFQVYLPMLVRAVPKSARNPRGQEVRPFLPGYVFAALDPTLQGWRCMFSTRGVKAVLMAGERPALIPDTELAKVRAREENGLIRMVDPDALPRNHKRGDLVALTVGGVDITATFESYVDRNRVAVFLNILGQSNRTVVSALLVK